MPLISGAAALTRLDAVPAGGGPDFELQPFKAILPGSEVRESIGFVPFEPGAEYQVGHDRWAFRVRLDQLRADPTAVRERLRDLLRVEREEQGVPMVPPRRVRELKNLAEEELLTEARPRSVITEGVLDGRIVHLGTTANAHIGRIEQLLQKAGLRTQLKTPWNDLGQAEAEVSPVMELRDPLQSLHGSTFLKGLVGDAELLFEPADGYVKLQTRAARVTLAGGILHDLHRYLEEGAELLAAKLMTAETSFRLDALTFRISGLRLPRPDAGHWIERLDQRLERIAAVWELLDEKYAEVHRLGGKRRRESVARERAGGANVVPFER